MDPQRLNIIVLGAEHLPVEDFIIYANEITPIWTVSSDSPGRLKRAPLENERMVFGRYTFKSTYVLYLLGFGFITWEHFEPEEEFQQIISDACGYIIVVDSIDAESLSKTKYLLDCARKYDHLPRTVIITTRPDSIAPTPDQVHELLDLTPDEVILECNIFDGEAALLDTRIKLPGESEAQTITQIEQKLP